MSVVPPTMQLMVLQKQGDPLVYQPVPVPVPAEDEVLIKILACGICRTDLHILDGELCYPKLPLIPGHEVIGKVVVAGKNVSGFHEGDVVGVPWLGFTCGKCHYCRSGKENLCENALFTGYTMNGGYAEFMVAFHRYCFRLPTHYYHPTYTPLLCAGLIGYRSYAMTGKHVKHLGLYGFGAAAHLLLQVAVYQKKKVYAFTKEGDSASQQFALRLGATWAGNAREPPLRLLDAAIIFAPAGELVPLALMQVDKGGVVVCGGIHMTNIPTFPYSLLWGERMLRSVANLTRDDGLKFLTLAPLVPLKPEVQLFQLAQANEALAALRKGEIKGAAVLVMPDEK